MKYIKKYEENSLIYSVGDYVSNTFNQYSEK